MAERGERRSVAYVDLEAVRGTLENAGQTPVQFAAKVAALARSHGRLLAASVYGDVSGDEAREMRRAGCEARLTSEDGEGSAPESVAIALDAGEALGAAVHPEVAILATDDAQLAEIVRRWKRKGAFVVAVVPAALAASEPAKSADRVITVEALLAGDVANDAPAEAPRRVRAATAPIDPATHDWTKLVLLLRDLEAKMPFVGMRWLKNKVLGPHNVGVSGIAEKQALLNHAVDAGLLETYRVGNRDEQGEPVTACRLLRDNDKVKAILAANPAPPATAAEPVEETG